MRSPRFRVQVNSDSNKNVCADKDYINDHKVFDDLAASIENSNRTNNDFEETVAELMRRSSANKIR